MPQHPKLTPKAETDPETHRRDGIGLPETSIHTPVIEDALRRLRRRGVRIHASHHNTSQYRSHLGHAINIPAVHIALQLPHDLPAWISLPRFRTNLGDSARYSPAANVWTRTHGSDTLWRKLVAKAPEVDWNPAQPWIEVHLTITDPESWLLALVRLLDNASVPRNAQPDLFA